MIAFASDKLVLVVRSNKMSKNLGESWKKGVPIEVLPMAHTLVSREICARLGGQCVLRQAHAKMGPVVTDNGNFILDWIFPPLVKVSQLCNGVPSEYTDWREVDQFLHSIPGLIETGLFVNIPFTVVSADDDGKCEVLEWPSNVS